ncbi:MAG: TfoX/Sxy family protein [Phycisphaeraceae bacterium]|nr:TfoX/Sxy family protein [Phycisphaeraceae bacterium]
MHSDPKLVERLEALLDGRGLEQRTMFGGICFFLNGNMCVGVWHNDLIARIGVDAAEEFVGDEHAKVMDLTGKPMRGWMQIEPPGIESERSINDWIDLAVDFVSTLPKKQKKKRPKKKKKKKK